MSDIYDRLSEPFPQEMERTVNKSGTTLTYLPIAEVINRMNRVLGVDSWSSEIIFCERDSNDPDWVTAHVRVTAVIGDRRVVHDGFGGQKVKRVRSTGDIVDLGDEYKGAVSDATKKAIQQFGVGLYLARDIEAMEIEYAMEAQQTAPEVSTAVSSMNSDMKTLYENFIGLRDKLSSEQRSELKTWWAEYSGGRPVPKASEFTQEDLEALIVEVTRMMFGGTLTVDVDADS